MRNLYAAGDGLGSSSSSRLSPSLTFAHSNQLHSSLLLRFFCLAPIDDGHPLYYQTSLGQISKKRDADREDETSHPRATTDSTDSTQT